MNIVPHEKRFWVCDGSSLGNLEDLVNALRAMSDDTFRCHVTEERNDFYNWIRDVIGDSFLAGRINGSKDRAETAEIVEGLAKKKCPYLSPVLECLAGGDGTVNCLMHDYHRDCDFKNKAAVE